MAKNKRFQVAVVAHKDALVSLLAAIEERVSKELDGVDLVACPYSASGVSPALASADAVVLGVRVEKAADDEVLVALLDSVKKLRGPQRSRALVAITLWGAHAEDEPANPFLAKTFGETLGKRLVDEVLFPSAAFG